MHEEVFAEIGCRLVLLQDLEMFITFAAKVVFAEDAAKARDAILNLDTKTLGQLSRVTFTNAAKAIFVQGRLWTFFIMYTSFFVQATGVRS